MILARSRSYIKDLWSFVTAHTMRRMLILFLFTVINPFELSSENDRKIYNDWQMIYAERYGVDHSDDGSGLDMVTVVTMTREEEQGLAAPRALDTFDYAELFERLANLPRRVSDSEMPAPRAIFVDMFLDHGVPPGWRGDAAALVDLTAAEQAVCEGGRSLEGFGAFRCAMYKIGRLTGYTGDRPWKDKPNCFANPVAKLACIRRAGGIPFLFAEDRGHDGAFGARPRTLGEQALHRIALGVPVQTSDHNYWLAAPTPEAEREKKDFDLSPAAALYWAFCAMPDASRTREIAIRCDASPVRAPLKDAGAPGWRKSDQGWNWSGRFDTPAEIAWAIGGEDAYTNALSDIQEGTRPQNCRTATPAQSSLWLKLLSHSISGITHADQIDFTKPAEVPCLYPHMLSLTEVDRITPELVQRGIQNRIILIGRGDNEVDRVDIKPIGQVPGVMMHAMALQNLIDESADYPKVATLYLESLNFSNRDGRAMLAALWTVILGGVAIFVTHRRNQHMQVAAPGAPPAPRHGGIGAFLRGHWPIRLTVAATFTIVTILPIRWALQGAPDWWPASLTTLLPPAPANASFSIMVLAIILESCSVLAELFEPARKILAEKGPFWRLIVGQP